MSNAPKIAVVVPIYNTESYLKECIESITNQTYKNITIFCIDDGSTDKSRDVIKKIKEEDPRIYLRTIKNSGVSVARNTALELINKSGAFDFVSFVDSDDLLDLEFYETAIKLLSKTKADFCALGVRSLGPNNNITPNEQNIDPYKLESNIDILKHFTAKLAGSTQYTDSSAQRILANKIFSYKIIKDKKFKTALRDAEDQDFFFQIVHNIKNAVAASSPCYYYRLRDGSLTHQNKPAANELLLYIKNFVESDDKDAKDIYIRCIANLWWWQVEKFYKTKEFENFAPLANRCSELLLHNASKLPSNIKKRLFLYNSHKFILTAYLLKRRLFRKKK